MGQTEASSGLSDWDLQRLVRRELARRPADPVSWQRSIVALLELAAELRRRLPVDRRSHPLASPLEPASAF